MRRNWLARWREACQSTESLSYGALRAEGNMSRQEPVHATDACDAEHCCDLVV